MPALPPIGIDDINPLLARPPLPLGQTPAATPAPAPTPAVAAPPTPEPNPLIATPPTPKPPVAGPQAPTRAPAPAPAPVRRTEEQRRQSLLDAERSLDLGNGRGRREVEEGDPYYDAAVLADELAGGHFDPLPGAGGLFYSWQGGNASSGGQMVFKNRQGKTVSGTAAQQAAALADMSSQPADPNAPAAASGPGVAPPSTSPTDLSAYIDSIMNGSLAPFGESDVARMRAQAFDDTAGGVEAAKRDAALRNRRGGGLYGSRSGSAALDIEKAGRSDVSNANRTIATTAATANFSAKMTGLQSKLEQIKGERDERMATARNDVERQQIAMQYKGLMDSTNAKIKAEAAVAQKGYDAERASGAAGRDFAREQSAESWQRELDRRRYEEPFRIAGYAP